MRRVTSLAVFLCTIQGCSGTVEPMKCSEYATGIYNIHINEQPSILAVHKSKFNSLDPEFLKTAIETAELSAKAALSKEMNNTKLSGVKKYFECTIDGEVVVGVYVNNKLMSQSRSLGQLIRSVR